MTKQKLEPYLVQEDEYQGRMYHVEFFVTDNTKIIEKLSPIKQIQAVPFVGDKKILIYKNIGGWNGFPGGTVEEGETLEETLRREVMEESASDILEWGYFGFNKYWALDEPNKFLYQVRAWADVNPLDQSIDDPCKRAFDRMIVPIEKAAEVLGWGNRGELQIDYAIKYRNKAKGK